MWLTLLLCSILAFVAATPLHELWDVIDVKHSWSDIPRGWSYDSTPPGNHMFDLHIGLAQSRIDDLLGHLMEVSEPTHPRYGQHLTKEEAEELVSSSLGAVDTVKNWLTFHGINASRITHRKGGGDWLIVRVTVTEAEQLLDTKYHVYHHEPSGEMIVRTLSYSLPHILHQHVDMIAPTTYFGTLRTMRRTSFLQPEIIRPLAEVGSLADPVVDPLAADTPLGCTLNVTPACLRALYNSTNYVPRATRQNQLGIAGYLDQYANDADLQTFLGMFRSDAKGFTVPTVEVNRGGNDQNNPGIEANLDVQYASAISYPTPNIYYSTGGSPPFTPDSVTPNNTNEPYLEWITYMLSQPTIPQVITTSYGDDEQTVPEDGDSGSVPLSFI
ncbi:hypothetical protein EST38_g4477 [Candolleomyces aberdarensis]|uniref:Peptidase S53 activation domain-containing protein n=1 Tax=Candolleomyces aberdarensis TaxID=2316362 RepID=A0A4Q2DPK3_9AGAR|nr:hypothetical protein EST38_g4477 [Candolleomyces aberdarensis]